MDICTKCTHDSDGSLSMVSNDSCFDCGNLTVSNLPTFYKMLTSPSTSKLCDVEFVVDGARFPAHRVIVAAASPVLEAMLTNGMRETNSKVVPISSTDQYSWGLALRFMYTGNVQLESEEIAIRLIRLSHHYEMDILLKIVEQYLVRHVVNENVFIRYLLAEELDLKKLATHTESKIEGEFTRMYLEKDFKLLPVDAVEELLKKDSLKVNSELDILKSILVWANLAQCDDANEVDVLSDGYDSERSHREGKGTDGCIEEQVGGSSESVESNENAHVAEIFNSAEVTRPVEAKRLLENVRVMEMKSWEVAMALKYSFVRDCSELVISFAQRLLSVSGNKTKPFVCEPIRRDELERNKPFTFTFKVRKDETPSGTWEFKVPLYSASKTNEATGNKWRLKIKENEQDGISVHVMVEGNSIKVDKYEIFLLRNNRNEETPYYLKAMNRTLHPGRGYGFRNFISKESVFKENSEFMSGEPESLTFGANIYQGIYDSSSGESED